MRKHIYQERALLKFNKYYIHGVRNNWDFEKAADEAFWKVREEILSELRSDATFTSNADRENAWSDCLEVMIVFRLALKNAPPDKEKLEEIRNKRKKQEDALSKSVAEDGLSTSEVVANAVVAGLAKITGEENVNGPKT
jgi:hypothetical protein